MVVPLIREYELRAPIDWLALHGAPIEPLVRRANLPERVLEPADGFLPARHLLSFFADGARQLDQPDFAFRAVLNADGSHLGSWGKQIPRCWRLRDALHCLAVHLKRDAPFLEAGLHYGEQNAWLWRSRNLAPKDPLAELQGEMYTVASMLRVVRLAAGPAWVPAFVRAESSRSEWLLEAFGSSSVSFGNPWLGISVPDDLLDLTLPNAAGIGSDEAKAETLVAAAGDLAGSLQQAIAPLVGVVPICMEVCAEIAEISPRTMRRRLAQEGTCWRRIRDRVLFDAARERMLETTLSLRDISSELGYSDTAHFTRAFRRWTGRSPGAYRRRRLPLH